MIRALVFDFDGLILDTETADFQSWRDIYAEHGCDLSFEKWLPLIGFSSVATAAPFNPYDHLDELLGRPSDRAAVRARRRQRYLDLVAGESALPGVIDYLNDARRMGLKVGVASNSSRVWVCGYLTTLGLIDRFDAVVCVNDVKNVKPHPEPYTRAVESLGARPGEAMAFEDSPTGLRSAKEAGLFTVAVPNPLNRSVFRSEHHDIRLTSLADMPLEALIAEVRRRRASHP